MLSIFYPDARFSDDGVIERTVLDGRSDVAISVVHERSDGVCAAAPAMLANCDALVVYHKLHVDGALLDRAARCRLIVRAGVGLNNIDLAACAARGVPVCNVPDYGTQEVADHTVALMLTVLRGTSAYNERLRAEPRQGWQFAGIASVRRIVGTVLGIAGLGRIGTAVAERAVGFGMKVVHFGGKSHAGLERVDTLDELLARSDVLSLHLPLTADTKGVISTAAVATMKRGIILINTARGALIDTAAVCSGLRSGQIAAVGLDVLPTEPPDLTDPLVSAWHAGEQWIRHKVVITPHAAFFSEEGFADLRRSSMRTVLSFFDHGELRNCVNEGELKSASTLRKPTS